MNSVASFKDSMMNDALRFVTLACISMALACSAHRAVAAEQTTGTKAAAAEPTKSVPATKGEPATKSPPKETTAAAAGIDPKWKRLDKDHQVWIDEQNKAVVVGGVICLRRGALEMFACLKGTKEHESIVAADTKAFVVHAGLLALGAEAGPPVQFQPDYRAAGGSEVDVIVKWTDARGAQHEARAQDWVRNMKTDEPMEHPWVFAGSGFWEDEETKIKHYLAEGGEFICVSNFPSAMLDLPIKSSDGNQDLMFDAFTDRIPELGTKVLLVLKPKLSKSLKPTDPK